LPATPTRWGEQRTQSTAVYGQAGGEGFEPPLTDPESAVLPLDEPPVLGHRMVAEAQYFTTARVFSQIWRAGEAGKPPEGQVLDLWW
jgi:hypothetical protein